MDRVQIFDNIVPRFSIELHVSMGTFVGGRLAIKTEEYGGTQLWSVQLHIS